jgi:hypothetical protein
MAEERGSYRSEQQPFHKSLPACPEHDQVNPLFPGAGENESGDITSISLKNACPYRYTATQKSFLLFIQAPFSIFPGRGNNLAPKEGT